MSHCKLYVLKLGIIIVLYGWVSSVDLHQSSYRYDLALEGNRILSKSYR